MISIYIISYGIIYIDDLSNRSKNTPTYRGGGGCYYLIEERNVKMLILKKAGAIALSFVLCGSIFLSGCGKDENTYLTKDGKIPSYDLSAAEDGYYILKNDDKKCYSGLKVGAVNTDDDSFSTLHYWLLSDMEKAIQELTAEDQLIIKNTNERPNKFQFVRLEDYGYTVGTNFSVIDNTEDIKSPTIVTFGDDINSLSPITSYLDEQIPTGHSNNDNVKITTINGKDFTENMLTSDGYLKNLTQDGIYKFSYYEGTKYRTISIKADSHLFVAKDVYESTLYAEMEDVYFVIAPTSDMPNGYYYLPDYGMFYYSGAAKNIKADDDKSIKNDTNEDINSQQENSEV